MNKKLTGENKKKKFAEYRDILEIIYHCGDGIVLRQQLVELALIILKSNKIKTEVKLSEMERYGLIRGVKAFANSKHKMILLSKYSLAQFKGLNSRDINSPSTATNNKLYIIFKIQLFLIHIKKKYDFGGIEIKKSKPLTLYTEYDRQTEVTLHCKKDFIAIKDGKSPNKQVERFNSANRFDFKRLLENNFIFHNIKDNTVNLYYLNINGDSNAKRFLDLIKKVIFLLQSYTKGENIKVKITILFYNDKEMKNLKKALNKERINKYYFMNDILYFKNIVAFDFLSLELDKNYNLARELS